MYPIPGPKARTENLETKNSGPDVLVYDTLVHHIHHLNPVSRVVWNLCDGHRPLPEIRRLASHQLGIPLDEDALREALTKLDDAHLLTEPLAPELRLRRTTRRAFGKRTAVGALAVIVSISAPTAAAAASGSPIKCGDNACVSDADCCDMFFCQHKLGSVCWAR